MSSIIRIDYSGACLTVLSRMEVILINTALIFSINVEVARGELVAVVGQVGAGKSSLGSALIGEMLKIKGSVTLQVHVLRKSGCESCRNLSFSTTKISYCFAKIFLISSIVECWCLLGRNS